MRQSWRDADGSWRTKLRGRQVFADPRLNKGTAFDATERQALGLVGLLPPRILHLDEQAARSYGQFQAQPGDLAKHIFLTALHDRNEVLFFRMLVDHLPEMLPIVYTPTVGNAIERYSHEYRRPRGIYLTVDQPELVESSLQASDLGPEDVDLLVATDGEAILGIGDWGLGGLEISVGKLAVYTAAGGLDPNRVLPVVLDVGTNRQSLLDDPLYLGIRHRRVSQDVYDRFIDTYVDAATKLFPHAMVHWEDFGSANARRILARYRDRILTFNDDVQGTGAVNLAAVMGTLRVTGQKLDEQRVVIFGAGTAGIGIADQLSQAMVLAGADRARASDRFWCVDHNGLLTDATGDLRDFQAPFARPTAEVAGWERDGDPGGIGLAEVVHRVQPTILIGTSGRPGAFTEAIVRDMAGNVERPVILPLSNPTRLCEATPADLITWTEGRVLVATGSPFDPVDYDGTRYQIAQANNALVFPGLGLGAVVSRASRVTANMLFAAAGALAGTADPTRRGAPLLPLIDDLRQVSATVAAAVAWAAVADGVGGLPTGLVGAGGPADLAGIVEKAMWLPVYRPVLPA
jgi:malate dehydrogenase (oxaloacetate-decarboxylating)